jgi:predicted dehydrogenase
MSTKELRVAVAGAGRWAERARIPGWQRDPRVAVAAVADASADRRWVASEEVKGV